jgi:hypothetical protein
MSFGSNKTVTMYSPLRHYYQIRNAIILAREYEKEFPATIGLVRKTNRREMRRALKYEGQFFRNLMSIILALRDGRRGIAGKYHGRIAL